AETRRHSKGPRQPRRRLRSVGRRCRAGRNGGSALSFTQGRAHYRINELAGSGGPAPGRRPARGALGGRLAARGGGALGGRLGLGGRAAAHAGLLLRFLSRDCSLSLFQMDFLPKTNESLIQRPREPRF